MGFREFIKPSWRKMVLFILLGVCAFFTFGSLFQCEFYSSNSFKCAITNYFVFFILAPLKPLWLIGHPLEDFFYLTIFLEIIWLYFLTCLIVWIFIKIKLKKDNPNRVMSQISKQN